MLILFNYSLLIPFIQLKFRWIIKKLVYYTELPYIYFWWNNQQKPCFKHSDNASPSLRRIFHFLLCLCSLFQIILSLQRALPTVELLFLLFSLSVRPTVTGARCFYSATPTASYFLSSRTYFRTHRHTNQPLLLYDAADVPLINSQIPARKETLRV